MKRRTVILTIVIATILTLTACAEVNVQVDPGTQPAAEPSESLTAESSDDSSVELSEDADIASDEEETTESEDISYPTLPLPEYHYYGPEDWSDYGDAVCHYLMENNHTDEGSECDLVMCTPIVLKVDDGDPKDVKVWGQFWVGDYKLVKTSLIGLSGGSYPGAAHLDITGETPVVTGMDLVEDGSEYDPSVDRIFGKAGLEDEFLKACDELDDQSTMALSYYINHNGLYITQYQDYGWPPVSIPNAPETREEDEIIDYAGKYGYTAKFDMRQICSNELDDADMFSSVNSDDWNDFLIEIRSEKGSDIDTTVSNLSSQLFDPSVELTREDNVTFNTLTGCTRLSNDPPYKDGEMVYVIYLVQRDGDILAIETSSTYSKDDEKQMYTDDIISEFLGSIELY